MKINFLQSGGGLPPFTYYKPVIVTPTAGFQLSLLTTSSSKSSGDSSSNTSEKGKITDSSLLGLLKDIDGLDSDTAEVYDKLYQFYSIKDLPGMPNTHNLNTLYILIILELKRAKNSKEEFDNAYNVVKENKGLSTAAITDTGKVVCQTLNGIQTLTPEEYVQNKDKVRVLTNSNLLSMRAYNRLFAFDSDILQTVSNGIGMETVRKYINEAKVSLGTTTVSQEGISSGIKNAVEGILFLELLQKKGADLSGMSIEGLYHSKIITKDLHDLALYAISYIYDTLPENAKTLLKIQTNGKEDGAKELIGRVITSQMSPEIDFSTSLLVDANGEKLGSNGKAKADGTSKNPNALSDTNATTTAGRFVAGLGQAKTFIILNGTADGIRVKSNMLPITESNKPIGNGATLQEISNSDFGGIINTLQISMGGVMIDDSSLSKIMTDGQAYSMDLPVDVEALAQGHVKPDMTMLKNKEKADEEIRKLNIPEADYLKRNAIYAKYHIPAKYDSNGNLRSDTWRRFIVCNATALNSAFKEDMTFSDLQEADDNETDNYVELYRKRNNISEKDWKFDKKSWWDKNSPIFNGHDSFLKGTVFIEMNDNIFNAETGSIKSADTVQMEALEQLKNRLANFNLLHFSEE